MHVNVALWSALMPCQACQGIAKPHSATVQGCISMQSCRCTINTRHMHTNSRLGAVETNNVVLRLLALSCRASIQV